MTKQEFISKQQAMSRDGNGRMVAWLVVFFGVLGSGPFLMNYVEHHPELARFESVFGIGLLVFLLGMSAWFLWSESRRQRRFGHRCPACSKSLIGWGAQIAIATGNCGRCGEKVFSEAT